MTKEEWKEIEDKVSGLFGYVDLLVDGHTVEFQRRRVGKNQLGIMTFVDGHYKGTWKEGDEEAKYLRIVTRNLYSPKKLKELEKIYGKRQWKLVKDKYVKNYTYFTPIWFSVSGIRKHYEKTFKDIKLVKINGVAI
jgi:hypothetical protein